MTLQKTAIKFRWAKQNWVSYNQRLSSRRSAPLCSVHSIKFADWPTGLRFARLTTREVTRNFCGSTGSQQPNQNGSKHPVKTTAASCCRPPKQKFSVKMLGRTLLPLSLPLFLILLGILLWNAVSLQGTSQRVTSMVAAGNLQECTAITLTTHSPTQSSSATAIRDSKCATSATFIQS